MRYPGISISGIRIVGIPKPPSALPVAAGFKVTTKAKRTRSKFIRHERGHVASGALQHENLGRIALKSHIENELMVNDSLIIQ